MRSSCFANISFACTVIFVSFGLQRFHSSPCGFMRFHCTAMNRFGNLLGCCFAATFVELVRAFLLHGMAAAISLVILVIRNHKVNFSQSSNIVEFWLLVLPFLFISTLSGITNFGPHFWPWSGSRLNFVNLPPDISLGRFPFHYLAHESDKLLFELTFLKSSTSFSCMTSRAVWVDLVTSMCFNGIGNVSSFGTWSWTRSSLWWR